MVTAEVQTPEKIFILGGVYPTLNFLDVLCVGKGEVAVVELMNALRSLGYDRR